jgi:CRP-like cAMP-binding protein
LLDDPYAWLRACAALYSKQAISAITDQASLRIKLDEMSCSDPDEFVREVAKNVLMGELGMDTLATLSLMERILFLRRVPLFVNLPPSDLKQLAAITSEVLFSDGQLLARQGETGTEMFIIVSGGVQVLVDTENQKETALPRLGKQNAPVRGRLVARRSTGDYVGEMAIINQEPRSATLIADGAVRALCISQKQFESILRERPEISLIMMRSLSRRLKEVTDQAAKS